MRATLKTWFMAVGGLVVLVGVAAAQTQPAPPAIPTPANPAPTNPAPTNPTAPTEAVQASKPEIFYLKDDDGNLQPVLGFTLDEFEKMLQGRDARGAAQAPPPYRLDHLTASGIATPTHAALTVSITISNTGEGWIRVPLRLGGAVLEGRAEHQGGGEFLLEFDSTAQEFVAWLKGGADKSHEIILKLLAPLSALGGEQRLKLSFPRATTTELSLDVPLSPAAAQASSGLPVVTTALGNGQTRLKVVGLGGDLLLSWRKSDQPVAAAPVILEASGRILARIDGRTLAMRADLTVRSTGSDFDSFRVRLPRGASLVSGQQSFDYTVQVLDQPNTPQEGRIVEIRLRSRTAGPVNVVLETEQPLRVVMPGPALECDVEGFQIIGQVRQWGHVAVQVVGDWQVAWGQRNLIRQVADLPAELRQEGVVAGFEYFSQPFSLAGRVLQRQTRLSVEPEYSFLVGARRVEMEARLKYRIGARRAFEVLLECDGWNIDSVGPDDVVQSDDLLPAERMPLRIPFRQPRSGELEILVRAHQTIDPEATTLSFTVPWPVAQVVAPGRIAIQPADNVDMTPLDAGVQGLIRQFARPWASLPRLQQPPLIYRVDGPGGQFAANMRVFDRSIRVDMNSRVVLEEDRCQVEQRLAYHVAREPVESLALDIPAAVANEDLTVSVDGQTLNWDRLAEGAADAADAVRVRVHLPGERIGLFELLAKFEIESPPPPPAASVKLSVPLVAPAEGDLRKNEVEVVASPQLRVQNVDGGWHAAGPDNGQASTGGPLKLIAPAARHSLLLGLSPNDSLQAKAARIDKTWIQTWLGPQSRRDRVVWRLRTAQPQLRVKLPPGARVVEAFVDDKAVVPEDQATPDTAVIPLGPADGTSRAVTVDLRYRLAENRAATSELVLAAPIPEAAADLQRVYWQLVLPRDDHLLVPPADLTEEWRWGWRHFRWGRVPLMDQEDLESWVGAAPQPSLPADVNVYVFSSAEPVGALQARTAPRAIMVFVASGVALLIGLAVLYVPLARHPLIRLVAIVLVATSAALYPEVALLLLQAAALGLVLALISSWLRRRARQGMLPRVAPPSATSSSTVDRASARSARPKPTPSGSVSTTATAAVVAPMSPSESQS